VSGWLDESRISEVPHGGVRSFATIQDVQSSHVKFKPRLIAVNGKVRANVKVREIEVLGSLHGKIEAADRVYIRKSAELLGDIH
jgi:bactofilin